MGRIIEEKTLKTPTRGESAYVGAYIPKDLYALVVQEAKKKTDETYIKHTLTDILRLIISEYFKKK